MTDTVKPNLNDALRNACCVLELATGAPTFSRVDRQASRKADEDHNAKVGTGKLQITFLKGSEPDIDEAIKVQKNLKDFVAMLTVPWGKRANSSRKLLANTLFETFITGYKAYFDKFGELRTKIKYRAPELIKTAQLGIGDYNVRMPTEQELVDAFYIHYSIEPVPSADGFGDVTNVVDTFLQRQFNHNMELSFKEGQADRLEKMRPLVARIVDRMEAYDEREKKLANGDKTKEGTFHGTLLSNVRDLAPALAALNITDDPGIQAIVTKLESVKHIDLDDLKNNAKTRKEMTNVASSMLGDIDKWLKTV